MGFLERLRREKEEKEMWAKRKAKREKEADEEAYRKYRDRQAKEYQLRLQAATYFGMSDFPQLVNELIQLAGKVIKKFDGGREENVGLTLLWDSDQNVDYVWYKEVDIICKPDGTIIVHGGWFGSTTLSMSVWQGRPDLQEKALEKAYQHPKKIRYKRDIDTRPNCV